MARQYVTQRDGVYRVAGTRVSLDSLVYAFLRGASPESIAQSFPVLSLEEVYGAIAFYLANQTKIDEYLELGELEFDKLRTRSRRSNSALRRKLQALRASDHVSRR